MLKLVLNRTLLAIPTLFILTAITFFLIRIAPGGPFDTEHSLSSSVEENLRRIYHLDEPLLMQFGRYLGNLVRGDFGPSMYYLDQSVSDLIGSGFSVSLRLGGLALLVALCAGLVAGTVAATRQGRLLDTAVMALAMTGISIPNFVVAPLLVLLFAIVLNWLPAGGFDGASHLVLPVIALALPQVAYIARLTRASMIEVLRSPYVRAARARGIDGLALIVRHCLKPAFLPVLSYLGPAAAAIVTGSVVVEQIFQIPGLGQHFVQGALNRDYTLVMGVVIFYGALIIVFNLMVDLLYTWFDPRVAPASAIREDSS